jgi:G3E family GTPase
VRTVSDLLAKRRRRFLGTRRFDRLVVEASGLASPGPVVPTLLEQAELARATRGAGGGTLATPTAIVDELERGPVAEEQVGRADLIVLNHADRAGEAELARAEAALSRRNALAPLLRATRADVPLARVLAPAAEDAPRVVPDAGRHHVHEHAAATIALSARTPLDLHLLKMWLQFLAAKRDHELWRVKGILACADHPVPVVVHGVHQWLEIGPGRGRPPEESVLVLIGRGFDRAEIERGWAAVR